MNAPLFPLEELSADTLVKLPPKPHAESGSVKLYITLAEPHLFLEGFTSDEISSRPPSILRGCLFLRVVKPIKVKSINLSFTGSYRTEWPEGIPPKRNEYYEQKSLINHTWPFFNYHSSPVSNMGADIFIHRTEDELACFNDHLSPVTSALDLNELNPIKSPNSLVSALMGTHSNANSIPKRSSKNINLLRFRSSTNNTIDTELTSSRSNSTSNVVASASEDNKLFTTGDYIYTFELPIRPSLPESIDVTFGNISYYLEANVERSGKFKTSLNAKRMVNFIRTPFQDSSEENEPIIINRDWEGRLQYDIVIYSKQVVLNSYLPISFRFLPLDKVKVHRLRVYIAEHLDYYCHNKKVHRTEPPKKILLLEHKPSGDSDNLLSIGQGDIGGIEYDFQVFVPEKYAPDKRLHPETSADNIQSHHWIKISIRISKLEPTEDDPQKRKQYELSIDSPMHLLSPLCAHANTLLPSYEDQVQMDQGLLPNDTAGIDSVMSPKREAITKSNLFGPTGNTPVEMMSPQAKPFSPIASPQLNAINPELRDTPTLSPIISPILGGARNIAPPPPFKEHPPTYEEAVTDKKEKPLRQRTGTSGTVTTNSSGSSTSGNKPVLKTTLSGLSSASRSSYLTNKSSPEPSLLQIGPTNNHQPATAFIPAPQTASELGDLEGDDRGIRFNITHIRSTDVSPLNSPSLSPVRNSKLISTKSVPAFELPTVESSAALDAALSMINAKEDEFSQDEITPRQLPNDSNLSNLTSSNKDVSSPLLSDTEVFNNPNDSMLTIDTLRTNAPFVEVDITDMIHQ